MERLRFTSHTFSYYSPNRLGHSRNHCISSLFIHSHSAASHSARFGLRIWDTHFMFTATDLSRPFFTTCTSQSNIIFLAICFWQKYFLRDTGALDCARTCETCTPARSSARTRLLKCNTIPGVGLVYQTGVRFRADPCLTRRLGLSVQSPRVRSRFGRRGPVPRARWGAYILL